MLFDSMEFSPYDTAERKARRAQELYEDGHMLQALDELETALEINPANGSWHFDKALTLDAVSRFEDAIKEYELALEFTPNDPEILNSLAVDYTRTGQYDLAIDAFERIESIEPSFEPCYCNRIITYTEMGKHDSAEQMFYMAQQIDPDCALCYYNIGNSLFARGEYKRAMHCWQRTAELESTHPQINYRIAQAYWAEGHMKSAREYFLKELRQNPGDTDVILDFGLFLLEAGEIESAKEKFHRILEFDPDSAFATFYLGEIAFYGGDVNEAVRFYCEALEKGAKSGGITGPSYRLAQCSLLRGRQREAKSYLLSEMKLGPEDPLALVSMGSMFLVMEEIEHATHCLLRAVDMDWASGEGYYYLGVASAMRGDLDDAAEFFSHAVQVNAGHVDALRDSASLYLTMGRWTEASERIGRALALRPNREMRKLALKIRRAQRRNRMKSVAGGIANKAGSLVSGKSHDRK